MITEQYIRNRYDHCLYACKNIVSIDHWVIKPINVEISNRKALGTAYSTGMISISKAYIGSEDYDGLDDTIRHELAHLAAGLKARHGADWKRMARRFGATPLSRGKTTECVTDNMYKYYLLAHLEDGRVLPCKPMNRRMRRYTQYSGWGCSMKGVDITRFQYVSYSKGKKLAKQG